MLKYRGTIPDDKDLFIILDSMGIIKSRGHFLDYGFYKVFGFKLKPCKDCAREFNRISDDWSVRVKAASDLFNRMYNNSLNLSGRDSGEIFERSIVSLNLPIMLLRRRNSFQELPQFTIL